MHFSFNLLRHTLFIEFERHLSFSLLRGTHFIQFIEVHISFNLLRDARFIQFIERCTFHSIYWEKTRFIQFIERHFSLNLYRDAPFIWFFERRAFHSIYWETHVSFNLLRDALFIQFIERCTFHSIYWESRYATFRALLAHPQEASKLWLYRSQLTLYARNIQSAIYIAPLEDEQVMLETCKGPWFSINWMKVASRWFRYADILWCSQQNIKFATNLRTHHHLSLV
jgi:hypothetical protein